MGLSRDKDLISSYCFFVYYDEDTKHIAADLRADFVRSTWETILHDFGHTNAISVGHLSEATGPHPKANFRIAVKRKAFQIIYNHLALFRHGLSVLICPETGDRRKDYIDSAAWMGKPLELRINRI